MRWLLLVAVIAGCAAPKPSYVAGPIQKKAKRPTVQLTFKDALGQPVQLGGQERVTVLVFMSRDSKDEATEMLTGIDNAMLNRPVEIVSVVDLRKYSTGLTRAIADRRLKQSAEKARVGRREKRERRGIEASDEIVNRWHLVGDFDGKIFNAFGVEAEPDSPIAFVVERSGSIHGPFRKLDGVINALERTLTRARAAGEPALGGPMISSAWRERPGGGLLYGIAPPFHSIPSK